MHECPMATGAMAMAFKTSADGTSLVTTDGGDKSVFVFKRGVSTDGVTADGQPATTVTFTKTGDGEPHVMMVRNGEVVEMTPAEMSNAKQMMKSSMVATDDAKDVKGTQKYHVKRPAGTGNVRVENGADVIEVDGQHVAVMSAAHAQLMNGNGMVMGKPIQCTMIVRTNKDGGQ
jgi:hypothetical protein